MNMVCFADNLILFYTFNNSFLHILMSLKFSCVYYIRLNSVLSIFCHLKALKDHLNQCLDYPINTANGEARQLSRSHGPNVSQKNQCSNSPRSHWTIVIVPCIQVSFHSESIHWKPSSRNILHVGWPIMFPSIHKNQDFT